MTPLSVGLESENDFNQWYTTGNCAKCTRPVVYPPSFKTDPELMAEFYADKLPCQLGMKNTAISRELNFLGGCEKKCREETEPLSIYLIYCAVFIH